MFDFLKRKRTPKVTPPAAAKPKPSPKPEPPKPPPRPKPDIPKREPKPPPKKAEPVRDCDKEFLRVFKQLTYIHSSWEVWKDFVTMSACAISNAVDKSHYDEREKLYMSIIKKYKKSEQSLFPQLVAETVMALELNPEQDFLGALFMRLDLGNNAKAQIFTPYHVCDLMAKITMDDILAEVEKKGYITIHDPCCGAGATLIAGINEAKEQLTKAKLNFQNHTLIVGQDVDTTVALMCYIQISLLGVAGYVKVGNTLTEPMVAGDPPEHYWFTPMYFSDIWSTRRLIKKMNLLFEEKETTNDEHRS